MRLASLLAAVSFGCALVACGGDDEKSTAQRCVDSWNAPANETRHQPSLAGAVSAVGLPSDRFRVGTWPKSERTVPVRSPKAAFARADGRAVVREGSCLIIVPPSRVGEMTFFEDDQGRWHFATTEEDAPRAERSRFPAEARRSVADAEGAVADALGKLKLE